MDLPNSMMPIESSYPLNLPRGDTPEEIRARIPALKRLAERSYVWLATDLWKVFHLKHYVKYGYETFNDYVEHEVGISRDNAYQMRRIMSHLVLKCGIKPSLLEEIGPSKARKMLSVANRNNAQTWVEKAKAMPYDRFVTAVLDEREARKPTPPSATDPETPQHDGPVTITVEPINPRELQPQVQEFKVKSFRLPAEALTLLDEALAEAQRTTKSAHEGFNLACIAQHFLAHSMTKEGKRDGRLRFFMRHMERIYGGRLLHITDDHAWDVLREAVESHPDIIETSDKEPLDERERNDDRRYDGDPYQEEEESEG